MMADLDSARRFWDKEIVEQSHTSWMAHPLVRDYINRSIDPVQPSWPMDWFVRFLRGRHLERGLSIGCGGGALERDVIRKNICTTVDAFDASVHSLHLARVEAGREGMTGRIRYFAADFNEMLFLPRRRYDVVFFHQSAHHIAKLEKAFRAALLALKPGGLLYVDEYVGPSRFEWNDALLAPQQQRYQAIPREQRAGDALSLPIQEDDPSEAFRSSEIVPQLTIGFRILARRDYGGNLLSVLFPSLPSPADDLVRAIAEDEARLLQSGAGSFYSLIIAEPRRGLGKAIASMRYFLAPKLQRIAREVRKRIGATDANASR